MTLKDLLLITQELVEKGHENLEIVGYDEDGFAVVITDLNVCQNKFSEWNPSTKTYDYFENKSYILLQN